MNEQLEANKKIVQGWHELAINQRKPDEAVARYIGPHYRQHNPGSPDGPETFVAIVKQTAQNFRIFVMKQKGLSPKAISWSYIVT